LDKVKKGLRFQFITLGPQFSILGSPVPGASYKAWSAEPAFAKTPDDNGLNWGSNDQ